MHLVTFFEIARVLAQLSLTRTRQLVVSGGGINECGVLNISCVVIALFLYTPGSQHKQAHFGRKVFD